MRGVGEVRQQGEPEARVGVGQVVRLQPLGQHRRRLQARASIAGITIERRVFGRDPVLEVELGKDARGQQQGEQVVDQPHRQLGERQQEDRHRQQEPPRDGQSAQSRADARRQERAERRRRSPPK